MWKYYNPNPVRSDAGDCTIRALTLALNMSWIDVFWDICKFAASKGDIPSSNLIWGEYLENHGFQVYRIPNTCPLCYTIRDFCRDNPKGLFVLGTGSHVVTVMDGDYYDTWDSGDKVPVYCFRERSMR